MKKQRIAVLASGSGSNAERIIQHFAGSDLAEVAWIGCNRSEDRAGVYDRTRALGMETVFFSPDALKDGRLLQLLLEEEVDWVILAGFLLKIPEQLVSHFHHRMINIHPALLPDFGGKGMYGMHVHRAVKEAKRDESGITVHWVTAHYDEGDIIFQAKCAVAPDDDPSEIAKKVAELEHRYYPRIADALIRDAAIQHEHIDE